VLPSWIRVQPGSGYGSATMAICTIKRAQITFAVCFSFFLSIFSSPCYTHISLKLSTVLSLSPPPPPARAVVCGVMNMPFSCTACPQFWKAKCVKTRKLPPHPTTPPKPLQPTPLTKARRKQKNKTFMPLYTLDTIRVFCGLKKTFMNMFIGRKK
jgi:hypothetical protein